MASYPVISSDDHVFEPADLWTSRLDKPFRDRAPHVIHRDEDDTDCGYATASWASAAGQVAHCWASALMNRPTS